jgi:hypothetical protein
MVSIMVGESAALQLLNVPLSNNTITRRIYDMSEDMNDQLIEELKYKRFGIQLDEATDNNNDAHLTCYVRFIDGEDNIVEVCCFVRVLQLVIKLWACLKSLILSWMKIALTGLSV